MGLIIAIVAVGVVLVAAIGGIFLALGRGSDIATTQPTTAPTVAPPTTISPSTQPTDPTTEPTNTSAPSPAPTTQPTTKPSGKAIELDEGISVIPADGWEVKKQGKGSARLSNGSEVFVGAVATVDEGTNPGQLCEAYHRKIADDGSDAKFAKAKSVELDTSKLDAATCGAQFTVTSGQGSAQIGLFSLISVRDDGVTVVATLYFSPKNADDEQLSQDYDGMVNSMLKDQVNG